MYFLLLVLFVTGAAANVPPRNNYTGYNISIPTPYGNLSVYAAVPNLIKPAKLHTVITQSPYPQYLFVPIFVPYWSQSLNLSSYVYVWVDSIGCPPSTGSYAWFNSTPYEIGLAAQWIRAQPWSNGLISSNGLSAMGIGSYISLMNKDIKFRIQYIGIATPAFRHVAYENGAYLTSIVSTMTDVIGPLIHKADIDLAALEFPDDPFWAARDGTPYLKDIEWTVINVAAWYDPYQESSIDALFTIERESAPAVRDLHRFIVSPNGHCMISENNINATLSNQLQMANYITFFAAVKLLSTTNSLGYAAGRLAFQAAMKVLNIPRWLWYVQGNGLPGAPGHFISYGHSFQFGVPTPFFLGDSKLGPISPSTQGATSYVYDPKDPYPTIGGYNLDPYFFTTFNATWTIPPPTCGCWDQLALANRTDVIHFDSAPFNTDMVIQGRSNITLYVSSDMVDTDFIINMVDVYPNTTRLLIQQGTQRMRWRVKGATRPTLMTPGTVYPITVSLWYNSYVLASGHRLGLDITSSNYPRVSVNPNNGIVGGKGPLMAANNTIYFGGEYPSVLDVPLLPLAAVPRWKGMPNIPFPHLLDF